MTIGKGNRVGSIGKTSRSRGVSGCSLNPDQNRTKTWYPNPYWLVPRAVMPTNLWSFQQTGNYSDQGRIGGVPLSAAGSGNTFNNGLVFSGAGYATTAVQAESVNQIGPVFSLIADFFMPDNGEYGYNWQPFITITQGDWERCLAFSLNEANAKVRFDMWQGEDDWIGFLSDSELTPDQRHQVILTCEYGQVKVYDNAVLMPGTSEVAGTRDGFLFIDDYLLIGAWPEGSSVWPAGSKFNFIGMLKGRAWSPEDVEEIYNAFA
jgi:hypothetical protein